MGEGTMGVHDERLGLAVDAKNAVNAYANEMQRLMLPIFVPLVGKQIIKQDKSLLDRVSKMLPKMPYLPDRHCSHYRSDYSLWWECHVRLFNNDKSELATATVRIGDIRDQILTKVYDGDDPLKTDYNVDEIREYRRLFRLAEKAAAEAKEKCYPFEP